MAEFLIADKDLTGLKGKVIIVTGGSSGIGLATVQLALSLGASVVNADVAAPPDTPAGAYSFIKTNVADWAQLSHLFKETKKIYGSVDHVFANAGLGPRADYLSTAVDENGDLKEPVTDVLDVGLKGITNTAVLAIYYQRQQAEGGSIVLCGSVMGLQRCRAVDYTVGKHGVLGLARGLHPLLEGSRLPIRVNTVAPTWTDSAVLPGLLQTMQKIGVEVQPASAVARATLLLMADGSRNGDLIHIQQGRFKEIDSSILLPALDSIRGKNYPAEDDVLVRAMAAMAG